MAITPNLEQGRVVYYGMAADRTNAAIMGSAPFGALFVETNPTSNSNCWLGTGNGTNWLGPYTAAEVGLGGGSSDVTGLARNRIIQVNQNTAPTAAGTGTAIWYSPGVQSVRIAGVKILAGTVPLTGTPDWSVWYALDAVDDAEAVLLLPSTALSHDANNDIGQVGRFNLTPLIITDYNDVGGADQRVAQLVLPQPVEISLSSPILRLDFRHYIGTGVNIELLIEAVEVV